MEETLNHHLHAAVQEICRQFQTHPSFRLYFAPVKISWWYLKWLKSYCVDRWTLLKTYHLATLSLCGWQLTNLNTNVRQHSLFYAPKITAVFREYSLLTAM